MDTQPIVSLEFCNRTATRMQIWLELCCEELDLQPGIEYRLESPETEYRLEFRTDLIVLYYAYRFGPKILRRPYVAGSSLLPWELVADYSTYG